MKKILLVSLSVLSLLTLTGCDLFKKKEDNNKLKHVYRALDSYCEINEYAVDYCSIEKSVDDYKKIENRKTLLGLYVDNDNKVQDIEICMILGKNTKKEKLVCIKTIDEIEKIKNLKNDYTELEIGEFDDYNDGKIYVSYDDDYIEFMVENSDLSGNDDQCYLSFDESGKIKTASCGEAN